MKYFTELTKQKQQLFYLEPQEYESDNRTLYQYALGANLYMNGLRDLYDTLVTKGIEARTVTICFEDSIAYTDVEHCEKELQIFLERLIEDGNVHEYLPAIFIRVRGVEHFQHLCQFLTDGQLRQLTGFVFPKFHQQNAHQYLKQLNFLNTYIGKTLYAMPILESARLIYKEKRISELTAINQILETYRDSILNIRLGGTDFSATYGLRRSMEMSIYDIHVIADCLADIVNIFGRQRDGYTISGPVWEYFSPDVTSAEVRGLLNEVLRDKENGLIGKTAIHPTQVRYINATYTVTYEEFQDATQIVGTKQTGGVFKSEGANKMNEIAPHLNWAYKIMARAHIYGVLAKGYDRTALFYQE
ncbi:MAG: HpcH/HpaI aldolase/citrate lyase family protein [Culicoidibacterales bacterium]